MMISIGIIVLGMNARIMAREVYIFNNTNETVTVKGPTKSTNRTAIPVALESGKVLIKNVDSEGSVNDMLDLTYIGNDSGTLKKYSRKYDTEKTIFKIDWQSPSYGTIRSETVLTKTNTF